MNIEAVVATLNEAFRLDPAALHAMICNRVPCNQALAEHPTIVVGDCYYGDERVQHFNLGFVGLLNGILGDMGIEDRIGWKVSDPPAGGSKVGGTFIPSFLGFCIIDKNGKVR
jgi:hypothetical protein